MVWASCRRASTTKVLANVYNVKKPFIMGKKSFESRPSGSRVSNEPRLVGDILTEMLRSNSPLAKNYRKFVASKENSAEKGGEL